MHLTHNLHALLSLCQTGNRYNTGSNRDCHRVFPNVAADDFNVSLGLT